MNYLDIQLQPIDAIRYSEFKKRVIFSANKWDPQIEDTNTIDDHVVLITGEIKSKLTTWSENLYFETLQCEEKLFENQQLWPLLGLPKKIIKALNQSRYENANHSIQIMRFDFHPTIDGGWAVSEVNRDVPGGYAESSYLPLIAKEYCKGKIPFEEHPISNLTKSLIQKSDSQKKIAFVFATSYSDDMQVMQAIAKQLPNQNQIIFMAPNHIRWEDNKPFSILQNHEGEISAIIRFYPAEWLPQLPKISAWQNFFHTNIVCANHANAILTQSKRLPLITNQLKIDLPTWRNLLPETDHPIKAIKDKTNQWILKPALGRVGEDITLPGTVTPEQLRRIRWHARIFSKDWVAQKIFHAKPLLNSKGLPQYLCIGVFVVNGKCCGFYGRISNKIRTDSFARDIAVLVKSNEDKTK